MEDSVRRRCGGRDAQGYLPHTFADDIRMTSLEAWLLEGLEKHVQFNRARLPSYVVLREESKHALSVEVMNMLETQSRRARHIQGEATRWTVERSAKARAGTARAKAKGSKDSKDSETRTRTPLNVGNVESAVTTLEGLLERDGPDQRWWFKGKEHKPEHNGC